MRLVTYRHDVDGTSSRTGVHQGDRILDAARLLVTDTVPSVLEIISDEVLFQKLAVAASDFAREHESTVLLPPELAAPVWEAKLGPPVPDPPSIRDFYGFEQHVAVGYRRRGREIPSAWFEIPVFYFAHTGNLFGPDDMVAKPPESAELDFELELALIIGRAGRDIAASSAWDHVAGFTIMNDWSARDIQRREMAVGLGPAKGKDFATSFGPALVTIDEVADRITGDRIDLSMIARINGDEVGRDTSASMHWGFPAMIERARRHVELRPGDIIGSGTCGGGCLFELGTEVHPWLEPGDEVELEIERIGRLRSVIA
jgi:fumarylacetoacetate (FAA) hydrolase